MNDAHRAGANRLQNKTNNTHNKQRTTTNTQQHTTTPTTTHNQHTTNTQNLVNQSTPRGLRHENTRNCLYSSSSQVARRRDSVPKDRLEVPCCLFPGCLRRDCLVTGETCCQVFDRGFRRNQGQPRRGTKVKKKQHTQQQQTQCKRTRETLR